MPRKKQQPQEGKAPKMRGYIAGAGEIVQQDISDTLRQNYTAARTTLCAACRSAAAA